MKHIMCITGLTALGPWSQAPYAPTLHSYTPFWRDLRNILPLQSHSLETNCDVPCAWRSTMASASTSSDLALIWKRLLCAVWAIELLVSIHFNGKQICRVLGNDGKSRRGTTNFAHANARAQCTPFLDPPLWSIAPFYIHWLFSQLRKYFVWFLPMIVNSIATYQRSTHIELMLANWLYFLYQSLKLNLLNYIQLFWTPLR